MSPILVFLRAEETLLRAFYLAEDWDIFIWQMSSALSISSCRGNSLESFVPGRWIQPKPFFVPRKLSLELCNWQMSPALAFFVPRKLSWEVLPGRWVQPKPYFVPRKLSWEVFTWQMSQAQAFLCAEETLLRGFYLADESSPSLLRVFYLADVSSPRLACAEETLLRVFYLADESSPSLSLCRGNSFERFLPGRWVQP